MLAADGEGRHQACRVAPILLGRGCRRLSRPTVTDHHPGRLTMNRTMATAATVARQGSTHPAGAGCPAKRHAKVAMPS